MGHEGGLIVEETETQRNKGKPLINVGFAALSRSELIIRGDPYN